ncbi:uncharacterized protein STEHIDRAFT_140777 [Stereum hirsutum FP-91666 SS1]|uniref:uncharacterized protein n=1 Tax=Stereum hirsutum (strain FP-91666) TaxID=721885 RepID=UPI0004449C4D|nr:uncharacterized protein STEHIDRAFT_140777 [Stereum hirsutum FP-91666 SS1]EIM84620.1 hypothetical protein STEHIDRAFT_140777 [Stereum hirsutum FP-91666 SS1]
MPERMGYSDLARLVTVSSAAEQSRTELEQTNKKIDRTEQAKQISMGGYTVVVVDSGGSGQRRLNCGTRTTSDVGGTPTWFPGLSRYSLRRVPPLRLVKELHSIPPPAPNPNAIKTMSWLRLPARRVLLASSGVSVGAVGFGLHEDKPSIYPTPDRDVLVIETPTELERQIGIARRAATGTVNEAHARVQGLVDRWIGVEHAVERRVKSIHDPSEPLTPSSLYIAISTLTGSILTRSRSLPLRFLAPPTFFFVSLSYFLPRTSANLNAYLGSLEDRYLPKVAHVHDTGKAHSAMGWEMLKERVGESNEKVKKGLEGVLGQVQDKTGLKVRDIWDASGQAGKEVYVASRGRIGDMVEKAKEVGGEVRKEVHSAGERVGEIVSEAKEEGVKAYKEAVEETKAVGGELAERESVAKEEVKAEVAKKEPPRHLV